MQNQLKNMPNNVSQISKGARNAKAKLAPINQHNWYVRITGMIGYTSISESVKIMGLILLAHLTFFVSKIMPTTKSMAPIAY